MADPPPHDDPALRAAFARIVETCGADDARVDGLWLRVRMSRLDPARRAGWKLHLSAAAHRYPEFIDAALPTLLEAGHPFKLARAVDIVEDLNDGRHGLAQVGKVVTVYPPGEADAAALAATLARRLAGHDAGPVIPGDLRFAPGAPVYFRYGPFDGRTRIDPLGRRRRVVATPDGGEGIDPADGGDAPTPAPEVLPRTPPADHLAFLRDDHLLLQVLHVSAKGVVAVALPRHAKPPAPVLLKTAKRGAQGDRHGRDAVWALRREHALLEELRGLPGLPTPGDLLVGPEAVAQVRPWIAGDTFWSAWTAPGAATPEARANLAAALAALAGRVGALHRRGVVVRDISPGNVLLADAGPVLLDLELAGRVGDGAPPYRRGTHGFHDPARPRGAAPEFADDHYALLALAWMTARGEQPGWCPRGLRDCVPPDGALHRNDAFGRAFAAAWEARGGADFPGAFTALLDAVNTPAACLPMPEGAEIEAVFLDEVERALRHTLDSPPAAEHANVYDGAAGLLAEAMDLAPRALRTRLARLDLDALAARLDAGARELRHIPGYHFGAPGVAAVLVRVGAWLGNANLVDTGRTLLHAVEAAAPDIPDLCQGQAGLLRAALEIFGATGDPRDRALAWDVCDRLVAMARPTAPGGRVWPWPQGDYGSLAGQSLYGHAHGVAGIASVLLRAGAALDHPAAHAVGASGIQALCDVSATLNADKRKQKTTEKTSNNHADYAEWWPVSSDDATCWNAWCHGNPGILLALTACIDLTNKDKNKQLSTQTAHGMMACNHGGWCRCHGLASRVWAWAEAWPLLRDDATLADQARKDAAVLARLALLGPVAEGAINPHAGGGGGLMTGRAGALAACLRFQQADPDLSASC